MTTKKTFPMVYVGFIKHILARMTNENLHTDALMILAGLTGEPLLISYMGLVKIQHWERGGIDIELSERREDLAYLIEQHLRQKYPKETVDMWYSVL